MAAFTEKKLEFDRTLGKSGVLANSLVPVDGKYIENIVIRNEKGQETEEYYKWQFIYSLIFSGMYI